MSDHRDSLPCRRFNLGDGMVMIAAVAVGMALAKEVWQDTMSDPGSRWFFAILRLHNSISLCVVSLGVAMLFIRFRRPCPPFIEALRQPGTLANVIAIAVWPFVIGLRASLPTIFLYAFVIAHSILVAVAIGLAWWAIWIEGYWRPERGWIDWTGRFLGCCWFILFFLLCSAYL